MPPAISASLQVKPDGLFSMEFRPKRQLGTATNILLKVLTS